jgi:tetratricopeptide (TPR) repeat protein
VFNISFREQLALARLVGRRDFDGAIRIVSRGLTNSNKDVSSLTMIAQCHLWADREDQALASAEQALRYDSKNFKAIELVARIFINRSQHETAVEYVRAGLENFPSPSPPMPRFYLWLTRALGRVSRRLKWAEGSLRDLDKSDREWYDWAKKYLAWYDETHPDGRSEIPTVH